MYENLPAEVSLDFDPMTEVWKEDGYMRAEVNQPGILQFIASPRFFVFDSWVLEGAVLPGSLRRRIPAVSKDFAAKFPDNTLSQLWGDDITVRHWYYPSATDYLNLPSLSWLDKHRYQMYSFVLEGE